MKYLYVITCGRKFCKVGVAFNPATRLKELQTGAPLKLRLFDCVRVASAELAYRYEAEAHRRLSGRSTEGEWFMVHPAEAMAVITAIISGNSPQTDAQSDFDVARSFAKTTILRCPHCRHESRAKLDNKTIWRRTFRCSSCRRSIPGRRFFIRRIA